MKLKARLLVLVSIFMLSILCACGEHVHQFSTEFSTNATHHWYQCNCKERDAYEKHTWDGGKILVAPTEESEGEAEYTCTACGYKKVETLPKEVHSHQFKAVASDEKYHTMKCECGEEDAKVEHTWDDGVVTTPATEDQTGIKTYTCTECAYEKAEEIEKLPHVHVYTVKAFSDEYSHVMKCECGAEGEKEEHVWDSGVITTPATEVQTGIKTFTCEKCEHKSTKNLPSFRANGLSFLQSTHYRLSDKLHATPLTLEAEIKIASGLTGRAGMVFANYYGIRQDWVFEIHENGIPRFYYSDVGGNVRDLRFSNVDVRTGAWMHIALTFDFKGGLISLYINGSLAQTLPCTYDLAKDVTRYQFVVGGDNRSNNGVYFRGQIRSVTAYADVRTAEEIARSATYGANLYADDIILSYMLNENSAESDIHDLTGNGYIIQKEWLDSNEVELDYAYSFAVVGDTQWLSRYKPAKMEKLYDWIVANAEAKKIAHVFGLGDITDAWNTADKENEWIRAEQYISKLNGVVPYSLVRGNHDESKYFNKYFATQSYMSQFDGFMVEGDIRNSYREFTIGTTDYLFITLDYGASDEILAWANSVVLKYPNHRVVVTTHAYHGYDGGHLNADNVPSSGNIKTNTDVDTSVGDNAGRGYNNGLQIWEKFISLHPNIFLVMSGHTPLEDVFVLQTEGVHGNTVTQMLIDAQWMDPQKDGVGMVCMLYFSEDGKQMEVEWICTDTGKYYKEQNQFAIDFTECLKGTKHDFATIYDENKHHYECDCGYVYGEGTHTFDGGVMNAEGLVEYTCACGYKKTTSATEDPTAIDLQDLVKKFATDNKYYRNTVVNGESTLSYFNGDKFWSAEIGDNELIEGYLTLNDIVMGKFGELRLDLGWSVNNGLYASADSDVIKGFEMFALSLKEAHNSDVTKVTVQEDGLQLVIKLLAGESVVIEVTVGQYAIFNLVNLNGESLGTEYAIADEQGFCRFVAPAKDGLVAEYEHFTLNVMHDKLEKTVCYSEVDVWDGVTVSEALLGSGTQDDPFLVQSGADLAYIAKVVNSAAKGTANFSAKYFKMTKSIDLNGNQLLIGSYSAGTVFHGYFDGNHCVVKGINATQSLFGMLKDGYIKNLSTYGTVTTTENKGVAGLVSYISNSTVENVTNYVNVTGIQQVAGVVGWLENTNTAYIKNCVNYGNITATLYQIGGIAGFAKGNIMDCTNFGNVTSTGNGYVGGVGGATKDSNGVRSNCVNYGNVQGTNYVGGVFGQINKTTSDCYGYGKVTATNGTNVGDVVGHGASYLVYTEVN